MFNDYGVGIPAYYDHMNVQNSLIQPSTVHCQNTGLQWYFQRYLLQRIISVFKWDLPEEWAENYFEYVLYCWGYISVFETDKFGVIPQACGLMGYDVMYQPTNAVISNPLLTGILQPRINKECTIIKLQPDYGGVMDIVNFYADMMALCAEAVGVNLVNSKMAYVFFAQNKAGAETFKKMFDDVASGQPAVVTDKAMKNDDGSVNWEMFNQDLKSTYITSDILSDMNKIVKMFDTKIGIPNANTDKRERLNTDEVNANNVDTVSLADLWLTELKKGCAKTRELFGIQIDVDYRFKEVKDIVTDTHDNADIVSIDDKKEGVA